MLAMLLDVTEVTLNPQHKLAGIWEGSDFFIKLTVIVILVFSVISWAIIGMKYRQLKKDRRGSGKFLNAFWMSNTIDNLLHKGPFTKSSVFHIFRAGVSALKDNAETKDKERIAYAIRKSADDEVEGLENYVPFLATVSSAAPFIGLFGTVWGILGAFWKLGQSAGSSSIEVVGPDIAQALFSTALGLMTAIPAVVFYNYFVNRIRILTRDLNQFAGDLANRIEDEYFKRAAR